MCIVLTGAGITDLRNGKVYNWWLVFGLAAGILCRGTAFFPGAAFFLIPSFLLFCFRMIGAGDGKLAAVTGGFLGIRGGLSVVMIGLFLGGTVVCGAYVEGQKLRTANGLSVSLCRESDGTENPFKL